jgi:carbon storage regulator
MLCLTRKAGESIQIGPTIRITVVATRHGDVRLAIDAPADILISRSELIATESANRTAATRGLPVDPGVRVAQSDRLVSRATPDRGRSTTQQEA